MGLKTFLFYKNKFGGLYILLFLNWTLYKEILKNDNLISKKYDL